jgi:hypothetical protein
MMLWALAYCSENRIPTTHLTDIYTMKASYLSLERFLPGVHDMREIRGRMETIVARIIVGEIPFFKDQFENTVDRHLRHKFWRESSQQSNVKISRFI